MGISDTCPGIVLNLTVDICADLISSQLPMALPSLTGEGDDTTGVITFKMLLGPTVQKCQVEVSIFEVALMGIISSSRSILM